MPTLPKDGYCIVEHSYKQNDEARAQQPSPRVPVNPSGVITSIATTTPKLHGFTPVRSDDKSMSSLTDHSDTDASIDETETHAPSSGPTSGLDTDTDRDDVEYYESCTRFAWLHKYCKSKNNTLCQQIVCMFVKHQQKLLWLRESVPAVQLFAASDPANATSDVECPYFDQDIQNSGYIEHEYGVSHKQKSKPSNA